MLGAAIVLALVPTPIGPVPIGVGPGYHPPPAAHGACAVAPFVASRERGPRVHLELFAGGRVVIVPAAIGVRGAQVVLGRVAKARCRTHLWTTDPTGVVSFDPAATLGDLFIVWGRQLEPERLLGFRGGVRVYVNGVRRRIDPRDLRLRDRDEIVLEVGPYIPPHPTYRFAPR
jgi:hypothetical protein